MIFQEHYYKMINLNFIKNGGKFGNIRTVYLKAINVMMKV